MTSYEQRKERVRQGSHRQRDLEAVQTRSPDSELKARDLAHRLCGEDKRLWGLAVSVIRPVLDAGEQPNREDALAGIGRRVEEIIRRTGDRQPKAHADELRAALRELKAAQ